MIDKRDLRIGNMFEQGIVFKISGRAGAKVHLHGKGKRYKGFRTEVAVEHLKPIVLSPQVLVEWCGFDEIMPKVYALRELRLVWTPNGFMYGDKLLLTGLHELQNLYHALNKKELEIKE